MVNIFLVDDHQIVKQGIKSLLNEIDLYQIVGEAASGEELLSQLGKSKIDLVITDITLEGMDGIELTKKIKKTAGESVKVIVLTMHADNYHINQCFEAGANGYMLKDFIKNELFTAIEMVMRNEVYTSRTISNVLANNYLNREFPQKKNANFKVDISKREKEIIELISSGLSNKEIAAKIHLSVSTVDAHRCNVFKKLEVKNTAGMIMKALKLKIIDVK
ncbi:DNA-binding response regulator [Sphingobacteriaceae bacterium]|nr:DNA-binding response regulator [Sphingobacteriaceae bacterium]